MLDIIYLQLKANNYYKYITGRNRGDRENKQVMLDVSEFGIEETVNILYQIYIRLNTNNPLHFQPI